MEGLGFVISTNVGSFSQLPPYWWFGFVLWRSFQGGNKREYQFEADLVQPKKKQKVEQEPKIGLGVLSSALPRVTFPCGPFSTPNLGAHMCNMFHHIDVSRGSIDVLWRKKMGPL